MGGKRAAVGAGHASIKTMRVAAYYQRVRLWNPTGVGKHIGNMTRLLSEALGGIQHIHAFDDYLKAECLKVAGVSAPDSSCILPIPRKAIEGAWVLADAPPVEWIAGSCDWVYCPAEYYVASRKAFLAVTIHCDNWFNRSLPWYNDRDIRLTRTRRRRLYEAIARKADKVLCVSNFLKDRMAQHFAIPEDRIAVVGNGVEDVFFSPSAVCEELKSKIGGRPYVCIIGGLTRRKGGQATMKIIKDMAAAKTESLFVVVGSSEPQFSEAISDLPNVLQAGYVSVEDGLPGLVAGAVAVLFLSRYETFGIPAIEAMAAGTVPIVSNYGALPELVGREGFALTEAEYSEVPTILNSLIEKPLPAQTKDALRSRARQFTWDNCAKRALASLKT